MKFYSIIESPLGRLLLISNGPCLTGVYFSGGKYYPACFDRPPNLDLKVLEDAGRQLQEYFKGRRKVFDIPLDLHGTPFQTEVWNALLEIPYGATVSYGELARRVGRMGAAQAVGAAVGRNPVSVIVPCHRVIGRNGSLTGYAGGLERKRGLLDLETSTLNRDMGATYVTGRKSPGGAVAGLK